MNTIRCRIAACCERLDGSVDWSFYLINDGAHELAATLCEVSTEWGDRSVASHPRQEIAALAPGANVRIWRDDGEFRTELVLQARSAGRSATLRFEFPKLYRQRDLPRIAELDAAGWQVRAEA